MTITTLSMRKKRSASIAVGALLCAAAAFVPSQQATISAAGRHTIQTADVVVIPGTLHHWPTISVADLDPATLHHWPTGGIG